MADQFKVGDVVILKSGGEPMTVTAITDDGFVQVTWQVRGKREDSAYHAETLMHEPNYGDIEPEV